MAIKHGHFVVSSYWQLRAGCLCPYVGKTPPTLKLALSAYQLSTGKHSELILAKLLLALLPSVPHWNVIIMPKLINERGYSEP